MIDWRQIRVSEDGTHHVLGDAPLCATRFLEVLKFHAPGLAPVRDAGGAYHVDVAGEAAYAARFDRTFGFYEDLAAVAGSGGWHHIHPDGSPAYAARFSWCGNYQEGRCAVRSFEGRYLHLDRRGEPVYPDRHRYAGDFRDGIAVVQRDDGLHTHVDRGGQPLHGRWFLDLDVFHKRFARARDAAGWTHVDVEGRPAYARRFAAIEPFYNGQARVERQDGGLEIVDEQGQALIELRPARRSELDALSADLVGVWRTRAIAAASELGVIDGLPARAADLAERGALHEDRLVRLLGALGELGLVAADDGLWTATDRGTLLRADHARTLKEAALQWARDYDEAWARLPAAMRRGGEWKAPAFFETLRDEPERLAAYHRAMSSYALHDYTAFAEGIDLQSHRTVLDAGGGTGALLGLLLRRHDHLRGVLLDRPEVAARAAVDADLAGRFTAVGGDLFAPWEARADAVVLARVLHDWDDAGASRILSRARAAIEPGGRLYVLEMVLPERGFSGRLLDLHMLLATGGRERTLGELRALLASAGFRLTSLHPLPSVSTVLVAEIA